MARYLSPGNMAKLIQRIMSVGTSQTVPAATMEELLSLTDQPLTERLFAGDWQKEIVQALLGLAELRDSATSATLLIQIARAQSWEQALVAMKQSLNASAWQKVLPMLFMIWNGHSDETWAQTIITHLLSTITVRGHTLAGVKDKVVLSILEELMDINHTQGDKNTIAEAQAIYSRLVEKSASEPAAIALQEWLMANQLGMSCDCTPSVSSMVGWLKNAHSPGIRLTHPSTSGGRPQVHKAFREFPSWKIMPRYDVKSIRPTRPTNRKRRRKGA